MSRASDCQANGLNLLTWFLLHVDLAIIFCHLGHSKNPDDDDDDVIQRMDSALFVAWQYGEDD